MRCTSSLMALLLPAVALAQTAMPTEFPADAAAPSTETLRQHVAGKVFRVKPFDGNTWRLEYKSSGYAYVDTSRGFRDTGKWHVEGSQLCGEWQKASSGCNETRLKDAVLYLKRSNGEVIALLGD